MSPKRIFTLFVILSFLIIAMAIWFQKLGCGEWTGKVVSLPQPITIPFTLDRDVIIRGRIEVKGQGLVGEIILKAGTKVDWKE